MKAAARTSMVKALHTVTTVSLLAHHLLQTNPVILDAYYAVTRALRILGYSPENFSASDPVVLACIAATEKLSAVQS